MSKAPSRFSQKNPLSFAPPPLASEMPLVVMSRTRLAESSGPGSSGSGLADLAPYVPPSRRQSSSLLS